MNPYAPFNYGTELGPLQIGVRKSNETFQVTRIGSNPLEPGIKPHPLIDVDEPIDADPFIGAGGYIPPILGGSGIIGGGSSDPSLPGYSSDSKSPQEPRGWGKCLTKSRKVIDCCSSAQKQAIRNAYKQILSLPCLSRLIFPGLLEDITQAFRKIIVSCLPPTECELGNGYLLYSRYENEVLSLCDDTIDRSINASNPNFDPNFIVEKLLHELIHASGGNEVDAISITSYCFPHKPYEDLSQYYSDIRDYCIKLLADGTKVIFGKYVMWSPADGSVMSLAIPGSTNTAPNGVITILFTSQSDDWKRDRNWIQSLILKPC
ncbi:MAG: hypothetical protein JST22_17120 [Bacteroidetes bacterium]|nr:hypothetical protein [Bacteroidota bacterium]